MTPERTKRPSLGREGFTLAEMAVVLILVSMGLAMALPRMQTPPEKRAEWVAQQLERDIELARTRAQATRKRVRMHFDVSNQRYTSYLDDDKDGTFAEDADEQAAFLGAHWKSLNSELRMGRGSASVAAPGDSGSGAVTFSGNKLNFSSRGIPMPLGTAGYIYIYHVTAPDAVAALRIAPSGSSEIFIYKGGVWQ
ncbi:MAG: GspH/FimT family pseudopilin [Longimicrobiales bacterium]